MTLRSLAPLFVGVLVFVGCGDPPPPPPPMFDAGDAGGMDAGTLPDADAGPFDAALTDTGISPFPDGGFPTCTLAPEDRYKLTTDTGGGDRVVGLAAGATTFGIVWGETRVGQSDVFGVSLSPAAGLGTAALGTVQQITDQFSRENGPTIAASGSEWIATWVDNEGASGFDVRSQLLGADLVPSGGVQALTATSGVLEDNATIWRMTTGPMVAWIQDDTTSRIAHTRRLNADGTVSGGPQVASDGASPGQVALGEIDGGPVLLWSQGTAATQEVFMQRLRADGSRLGTATVVSEEANTDGTVDAAIGRSGGAFVFGVLVSGVRSEVRYRAVGSDGMPIGSERPLFDPPVTGRDGSIAAFAGGYVVTYRRIDTATPSIQLALVTSVGDVENVLDLGNASASGGRTTVRVSGEGHIAVTWADNVAAGSDINAALIRCGI